MAVTGLFRKWKAGKLTFHFPSTRPSTRPEYGRVEHPHFVTNDTTVGVKWRVGGGIVEG
jgi:hypothetical protein